MYIVPPFVPKVIEHTPDTRTVYESLADFYATRKPREIAEKPGFVCRQCDGKYHTRQDAERADCYRYRYVLNFAYRRDHTKPFAPRHLHDYVRESYPAHSLREVVKVTNELGDDLGLWQRPEQRSRRYRRSYASWMASWYSPENRGLLPRERTDAWWYQKYPHYSTLSLDFNYRGIRTTNERRQIAACLVDEQSPAIRAKRGLRGLRTAWDDLYIPRERSWKKKKVRKQWQVNLKG